MAEQIRKAGQAEGARSDFRAERESRDAAPPENRLAIEGAKDPENFQIQTNELMENENPEHDQSLG
jgi:hypothetical protein